MSWGHQHVNSTQRNPRRAPSTLWSWKQLVVKKELECPDYTSMPGRPSHGLINSTILKPLQIYWAPRLPKPFSTVFCFSSLMIAPKLQVFMLKCSSPHLHTALASRYVLQAVCSNTHKTDIIVLRCFMCIVHMFFILLMPAVNRSRLEREIKTWISFVLFRTQRKHPILKSKSYVTHCSPVTDLL